jgi:hypothetical protein
LAVSFAGAVFAGPPFMPSSRASPVATAQCAIGNLRGRFIDSVIPCPRPGLQEFFAPALLAAP